MTYSKKQMLSGIIKMFTKNKLNGNYLHVWKITEDFFSSFNIQANDGTYAIDSHRERLLHNMSLIQDHWSNFQFYAKIYPPEITATDTKEFSKSRFNRSCNTLDFAYKHIHVFNEFPSHMDEYVDLSEDELQLHVFHSDTYYLSQKRHHPNFQYFRRAKSIFE